MVKCIRCGKTITDDEPYACLWGLGPNGVVAQFICLECSNSSEFVEIDPIAPEPASKEQI